ncbi:MAG: carboxypeptidase regulatory-like domain-containing protein [Flavobacterium sp.]|nr:carboxypeptidase regulatory-like domain-containing protein [Flavobacterium sp.]
MKKTLLFLLCCIGTISQGQTISGTIKNASGEGIKNALVCQADKPSIFKKTDVNGKYTIAGSNTTKLRIAALGYETVKSTLTRNVVLKKDPLLNTDVFHISFDHLRAGDSYTETEFKTDFNSANGIGFSNGSTGSNRASVDYKISRDPGGVSLKVKFPKGKLKTADSGIDGRIPLKNTFKDNDFKSSDLYVSYWVKFSDNFDFTKCGGKLPSLGGSDFNSRENTWKGRIMWRKGGSIQFYMELPDNKFNADDEERFWGKKVKPGDGICNFQYTNYLAKAGWHNIELHYKFESPGKNNGIFEGWVDGVNYDFINATVFNNYKPKGTKRENITINAILLSSFLGGSGDAYIPDQDEYAWFDEIRVSTKRINEFSKYSKITREDILSENNENTTFFCVSKSQQRNFYHYWRKRC